MDSESKDTIVNDVSWTEKCSGLLQRLIHDIYTSPINLILVALIVFLLVKLFLLRRKPTSDPSPSKAPPQLPKMAKCDLTVEELRKYNGTDSDGRILTVIYGDIFDVSKRSDLYGPGRIFSCFDIFQQIVVSHCNRRIIFIICWT
jgi:membrane-associated progesterone receptor component